MSLVPVRHHRALGAARLLAAAAMLFTAACDEGTAPAPPLEGRWLSEGTPGAGPTGATIEMTLEQEGDVVSGVGSMIDPLGFPRELTVSGTMSGDVVMLTFEGTVLGEQPMIYSALLGDDAGTLTGRLAHGEADEQREFTKSR